MLRRHKHDLSQSTPPFACTLSLLFGRRSCTVCKAGFGSQSSAGPLGFCRVLLQQGLYYARPSAEPACRTPKKLQNSGEEGGGSPDMSFEDRLLFLPLFFLLATLPLAGPGKPRASEFGASAPRLRAVDPSLLNLRRLCILLRRSRALLKSSGTGTVTVPLSCTVLKR